MNKRHSVRFRVNNIKAYYRSMRNNGDISQDEYESFVKYFRRVNHFMSNNIDKKRT